jgi:hypothetical protein
LIQTAFESGWVGFKPLPAIDLRAENFKKEVVARQASWFESLRNCFEILKRTEIPENGDDRDRTDNLRLARAALSQLSYVPGFLTNAP